MADENELNVRITGESSGLEGAGRRSKDSLSSVDAEATKLRASFRRLMSDIDPLYVAQEKYNKKLAENRALLREGMIGNREFADGMRAARLELQASQTALEKNSVAGRQALAEARATRAAETAAIKAAAAEAKRLAREEAEAKKAAAQEAAAAIRVALAAEREAKREATAEAKRLAAEQRQVERAEAQAAAEAIKLARREEREATRQAAADAKTAARDKARAEREATVATREAAAAAKATATAEREEANAVMALRASIDPAFAAQMRFNDTMRVATSLLMSGKLAAGEWSRILAQARAQQDLNVRSMGRLNSVYVQMGYQSQDVVASLASGINPMVILAQQGGQTAAALSQLGGRAGAVASFFAGPWGAAILGATMVLGYLLTRSDEAKHKTEELRTAEDARRLSLTALTEALKAFNQEQRTANENTEAARDRSYEAARAAMSRVAVHRAQIMGDLHAAQAELAEMTAARTHMNTRGVAESEVVYGALINRVRSLRTEMAAFQETYDNATSALVETQIQIITAHAESSINGAAAAQQQYYRTQTRLYDIYRASNRTMQDTLALQHALAAAALEREAAERRWQDSQRRTRPDQHTDVVGYGRPLPAGVGVTVPGGQFGAPRSYGSHVGQDLAAPAGTAVFATQAGRVEEARFSPGLGYYVVLNHGAGITTRYGHLQSQASVGVGEMVTMGQRIGSVGATGSAAHGNHLHYEVRRGGRAINPNLGRYPADQIDAEQDSEQELHRIRQEGLQAHIAQLSEEQAAAGENYQEVLRLQDQKITSLTEFYGAESTEVSRAQRERIQMETRFNQQILSQHRKTIEDQMRVDQARVDNEYALGQERRGIAEDNEQFLSQQGVLSPGQELAARRELLNAMYQAEVDHEAALYALHRKAVTDQLALMNLTIDARRELNDRLLQIDQDYEDRTRIAAGRHNREVNRLNLETVQQSQAVWRSLADDITGNFSQMFQGMWRGTTTFMGGLVNLADTVLFKFVDMGLKAAERWVLNELFKTEATVAGVAARTAAQVGGDSIATASSATHSLVQIAHAAAVAAARTYAAIAAIPIVGPFLAPAAAVAALAAVLYLGSKIISARDGYDIPSGTNPMVQLHEEEMVLPAKFANPLRSALHGAGPQSSSATSKFFASASSPSFRNDRSRDMSLGGLTVNALDGKSVQRVFRNNRGALADSIRSAMRDGMGRKSIWDRMAE